jgi:CubicO group peptidase (beta-lactamase class C family)
MINPQTLAASTLAAALCAAPALGDIRLDDAGRQALESRIESGELGTITSLLILQDGAPVFEGYYNGANAETQHDTRSATKTVTGMLVGAAIADGHMSMDQPVSDWFEAERPFAHDGPRKDAILPVDLLTMSGPLDCDDWTPYSRGGEEWMYGLEDWARFFWDLPLRGFPSWTTPPEQSFNGRAFSYCTAGVQMLGEAVERSVDEPLDAYAQRRLFDPLGIEAPGWQRTGSGRYHLGGGLRLRTRDLAALGELQRQGGRVGETQVLPSSWTQAAVTPAAEVPDMQGVRYGYLWWLRPFELEGQSYDAAEMNGNGGNRVWVLEEFGVTVVLTKTDFNTQGMHETAEQLLREEILPRLSR